MRFNHEDHEGPTKKGVADTEAILSCRSAIFANCRNAWPQRLAIHPGAAAEEGS